MDVDPISDIGSIEYDYAIIAKMGKDFLNVIKNQFRLYNIDDEKVLSIGYNNLQNICLLEKYLEV